MLERDRIRRILPLAALFGLVVGGFFFFLGRDDVARWIWAGSTALVFISWSARTARKILRRESGVDLIALAAA